MKNAFARLLVACLLCAGHTLVRAEDGVFESILNHVEESRAPLGYALASGFRSKHLNTRLDYNESNGGLGLRLPGGWTFGAYDNSFRRYSIYAGREFQWRVSGPDWMPVRIGGVLGMVSGYEDGISPGGVMHGIHAMLLPELVLAPRHVEAVLFYVPSFSKTPTTLALQLRITF